MPSRRNRAWEEGQGGVRRLNLVLKSRVESADLAESRVVKFAEKAGYGARECEEIALAVRESMANAVFHGNRCDEKKKVFLNAELRPRGLVISVRDEGEGFDPDAVADPLAQENLMRESGRGFFLMRTLMDEVTLKRTSPGGMELTMVKYLSKIS